MERMCAEKTKRIDGCLQQHEMLLQRHGDRLDKMDIFSNRLEERLDGLIKQLARLNNMMLGFMGLIMGGIVSFFFYAIQTGIFG